MADLSSGSSRCQSGKNRHKLSFESRLPQIEIWYYLLDRIITMPKLYEYFGLIVMFYANEHEPVHVHGKCQGRESKAEIIVLNGTVTEIRYSEVAGRAPLEFREMKYFQELVSARANDIVQKWIDFFVLHKSIKPERITGKIQ